MERRVFVLGNFLDLAVQFGGRSLVDAAGVFQTAETHSLQHAQHAGGVNIGGKLGHVKADLHVALGGKVVDFVGAHGADNGQDAHGVAEVAIVQVEVGMAFQVGNALTVVNGRTADDTVDIVAFFQQELCQIAAVLAGHAGDESFFHSRF